LEETREQQNLFRLLQVAVYFSVLLEFALFHFIPDAYQHERGDIPQSVIRIAHRFTLMPMYASLLNSKLFTLLLLAFVTIGTLGRKDKDLDPKRHILLPTLAGLLLFFGSIWFYGKDDGTGQTVISAMAALYISGSLAGTIMLHIALDNVSKLIASKLGKDRWNVEEESFMQTTKPVTGPFSVNIPMLFYYRKKIRKGYIPIDNVCRGTLVLGVPGSGKSYGVISPFIRGLLQQQQPFCLCVYDFKFPDLGKIAYYHYLLAKQRGKCDGYRFHVINLTDVEKSRRINPLRADYIQTLADASETAEALIESLKKGDKSGGSDQFFTQSAVNFLAACIYFFSRYEHGRYSTLPHVLAFLNKGYDDIFRTLFTNRELVSLLSPFVTAYRAKAFEQLEGQVGTLKIFISRLATKETFWVFSRDDFNLKISDPTEPGILVLANDPNTQNIVSACYSVVLNRLSRLINSKGNLPSGIVIDESPTLYFHRGENLISQARSNKVAVLLGLQELPMLQAQYGKETAATITSVVGNVLAGAVRSKDTLSWLETLLGKVRQQSESVSIDRTKTSLTINERLDPLIPAGKIAALKTGEIVGILAGDARGKYTGEFENLAVHCRVNLDPRALATEEKGYRDLPDFYSFGGRKEEVLTENFFRIDAEVDAIIGRFRPETPPRIAPVETHEQVKSPAHKSKTP
jgi:hypothetical protein